jgi:DNA-binding transcriptional regulator GbsR (MarR family)
VEPAADLAAEPEEQPVLDFVEHFAAALVVSGMSRMAARVFALLLSREDGSATSAELAEALQASPAAISGAVRYLIQVHLVTRSHRPGERRDVYRLVSDHWYEMFGEREHDLQQLVRLSREGVDAVGSDTRAGRRLEETARFLEFWIRQMSSVLKRWRSEARKN